MADYEVIHVAVAPPATLDANLVKSVAAVINKSPYDTRLLLAGEIPKIIAHYNSIQIAESGIQNLRDLGLVQLRVGILSFASLHKASRRKPWNSGRKKFYSETLPVAIKG
ncbi:MAG: hypothetical protein FJ005_07625 [Chloroflexi bacterium]|nr:hypothetical protein [Chloroflexota bacterium]